MGIKSTVDLTRKEAEEKLLNYIIEYQTKETMKLLKDITNKELEELLEEHNDFLCGGEGLENYLIEGE